MSEAAITRRDVAVIVALSLVLFGVGLGARDLWNPNEPAYGLAVVEMAERSDWRQPTVEGRPFDEKPVGYFWLARLASLPFGVNEASLRVPSMLATTLLIIAAYLWALSFFGRTRARYTAAVLVSTYVVFWQARVAQMDSLLAAATTGVVLALSCAWSPRHESSASKPSDPPSWMWMVVGAIALAWGLLAKGPVALVVAGAPPLVWLVVERRWDWLRRPSGWVVLAAGLALAAPWFVLQGMRGDGLAELLWRQNVERFTNAWDHQRPVWYYLVNVWIDFAPWVWCLPVALGLAADDGRDGASGARARGGRRLAWCWILVTILFFSISDSKRSVYILPVAAPIAALAADVLVRLGNSTLSAWRRRWVLAVQAVTAGLLLSIGAALHRVAPARFPELSPAVTKGLGWALLVLGAAIAASVAIHRLRPRWTAVMTCAALALSFWSVTVFGLPAFDAYKSARRLGDVLRTQIPTETPVYGYRMWAWRAEYAYYSGRSLIRVDELAVSTVERACVVSENEAIEEVQRSWPDADVVWRGEIGSRTVVLTCRSHGFDSGS